MPVAQIAPTMPWLRLDHVCLRVTDVGEASARFRDLGFTVTPGGRHGGGLTANALNPPRD